LNTTKRRKKSDNNWKQLQDSREDGKEKERGRNGLTPEPSGLGDLHQPVEGFEEISRRTNRRLFIRLSFSKAIITYRVISPSHDPPSSLSPTRTSSQGKETPLSSRIVGRSKRNLINSSIRSPSLNPEIRSFPL